MAMIVWILEVFHRRRICFGNDFYT